LFQEGEDDKATANVGIFETSKKVDELNVLNIYVSNYFRLCEKDTKVQALDTVTVRCVAAVDSFDQKLEPGIEAHQRKLELLMHVQEDRKVEYGQMMHARSMVCMHKWKENQSYPGIYVDSNLKHLAKSTYKENYYFACPRQPESRLAIEFDLFLNYIMCSIQSGDRNQKEVHGCYYFGRSRPPEIHAYTRRPRPHDVLCLCAMGWGPPTEDIIKLVHYIYVGSKCQFVFFWYVWIVGQNYKAHSLFDLESPSCIIFLFSRDIKLGMFESSNLQVKIGHLLFKVWSVHHVKQVIFYEIDTMCFSG